MFKKYFNFETNETFMHDKIDLKDRNKILFVCCAYSKT